MIDLNSLHYDGKLLQSGDVLKHVSEEQVYVHYIGDEFLHNRVIHSPLRTDKVPSFSIFNGSKTNKVIWKDFATKQTGDCFTLVKLMFSLENYPLAVRKVAIDFGLIPADSNLPSSPNPQVPVRVEKLHREEVTLKVRYRNVKNYDRLYWETFGIKPEVLKKYHVYPINMIFLNDHTFVPEKHSYAYLEYKDSVPTYKVYQPFKEKRYKFINNNDFSVWEGWQQLPNNGTMLIITSSRKDVMSIVSTTGIPSIALQSENVLPKAHIVDQLKHRFEKIYVLYDNDEQSKENWGQIYGERLAKEFNLTQITIPSIYECKDYSDLVKRYGITKAKEVLLELIQLN